MHFLTSLRLTTRPSTRRALLSVALPLGALAHEPAYFATFTGPGADAVAPNHVAPLVALGVAAPLSLASRILPAEGVALRWNEIARTIALRLGFTGTYTLADLHAAQALAIQGMDSLPRYAAADGGRARAAEQLAVSAASVAVLRFGSTAFEMRDWVYVLDAQWRADSLV